MIKHMKGNNILENVVNGLKQHLRKVTYNPYEKVGFNWFKTRLLRNLQEQKHHSIRFLEHSVSFRSRSEFLHSIDEIFIEEIYKLDLKRDAYIIDCGANIGLSIIYLKRKHPKATIIAFEPDTINFDLLQQNIAAFGFDDVILRKEAVWTTNTKIHFSNDASQMSRINEIASGSKAVIEVEAIRLKDILSREIDFLKIDIEGAEYHVLKDIEPTLHYVQNLFIEYHGTFMQNYEFNQILEIVSKQGFNYYIKNAADKHPHPFLRQKSPDYDLQLNVFCFRI